MNPKNHKKNGKNKNLLATDSRNQIESTSDVDEKYSMHIYAKGGESE
jgi:hypothetical protein